MVLQKRILKMRRKNSKRSQLKIILTMAKSLFLMGVMECKPSFFYKLIKGYLEVKYFGRKKIQYLEIMSTHACNAECDHCSNTYYDNRGKGVLLTKEKIENIICQAGAMDIPLIVFLGGEPMLDPNIYHYVKYTWERGIMPMIGTNGQLLNKENLKRLKDAHIGAIAVTIYSTDPKENESITKVENYLQNALNAVKTGSSLGINMSLKSVVNKKHFESGEINRIVDLASSLGIRLSFNPVVPTGSAYDNYQNDILEKKMQDELDNLVKENSFLTTHLTSNYFGYGCPAGKAYMGISAYGDVIPCFFMPLSYGNIWENNLKEIHQRMLKTSLFKEGAKTCVAAYDVEFINEVIAPCFVEEKLKDKLPVSIEKHPSFNKDLNPLYI